MFKGKLLFKLFHSCYAIRLVKMASLAEQFLDDVESADDSTQEDDSDTDQNRGRSHEYTQQPQQKGASEIEATNSTDLEAQAAVHIDVTLLRKLHALGLRIAKSQGNEQMQLTTRGLGSDAEYALVVDCAAAIAQVDEAILSLHRTLLSAYSPAFPELETLILNPMDYARVARLAADHDNLSSVDFRPILPSASVITVQVTASSSAGRILSHEEREKVRGVADAMTLLDVRRAQLLEHVVRRAKNTAPNLVAVVGGAVAAKLISHAGGLQLLAQMPSGNVKVLGKARRALAGTSSRTTRLHDGMIHTCPLVMNLPPKLRPKAGDVVAGKACLAARVDACRESRDGAMGAALCEELLAKFAKMQERPPARTAKPLPIPGDEAKRRHRGGARARKEKERLGLTDARKLSNRLKFGEAEQIKGNDLENEGLGMLGAPDSQRLRVRSKKTDTVSIAAKRKLEKQKKREGQSEADRLGITSSIILTADNPSSKALADEQTTPLPAVANSKSTEPNSKYFTPLTPFLGVDKSSRQIAKP